MTNNSSAATRGEVTTMDDEKTLRDQITERVAERYPEASRTPPPSWRTVAAGALDGLAAMLRGSW